MCIRDSTWGALDKLRALSMRNPPKPISDLRSSYVESEEVWAFALDISQWIGFIIHSLQRLIFEKDQEIHGTRGAGEPVHREDAIAYCTVLADMVHFMGTKGCLPYDYANVFTTEVANTAWWQAVGIESGTWTQDTVREWFVRIFQNGYCDRSTTGLQNPALSYQINTEMVVPKSVFGEDYNEWSRLDERNFILGVKNGSYFSGGVSAIDAGIISATWWNNFNISDIQIYSTNFSFFGSDDDD